MELELTAEDEALLAGDEGPAAALAMRILRRMAEIQGARRFIPIESAHVDGCAYEGDAILEFVEHLAALGGRVRVPTTLNAVSVEVGSWRRLHIPEEFGGKATRIVEGYLAMGCRPTFSCSPYQIGHRPAFGQHIAWAESNAIAFANSVLGARTDRYGDFLDICAALTGRVPEVGLHRTENRRGQIVFRLADDVSEELRRSDILYPVLGYLIGSRAQDRIPVVEGLPRDTGEDRLKALLAASASSGAVALMHFVGLSPEAPDLEGALQGLPPEATVRVGRADLRAAYGELNAESGEGLDAVVLGSPHFSPEEFQEFARESRGLRRSDGIRVLITTSRVSLARARDEGSLAEVERFGAEIVSDTCILLAPLLGPEIRTIMTNSGKYAHYSPGRLGVGVVFGSLRDCVRSAAAGRVVLEDALWN